MADLEAVLADVSYLMAMEKSKSTPAARASKKIVLPDPSVRSVMHRYMEKNDEVSFHKVFNQRLGYLLFKEYCETLHGEPVPQLYFYEEIKKYERIETDKERHVKAREIYDNYIMGEELGRTDLYPADATQQVWSLLKDHQVPITLFEPYMKTIFDILETVYEKFLVSEKYTRFCQWKNLELNIQLTMNDFSFHRIIGRGGFGEVYGCRKADTGKMYAMKCLDKKRIKMKQGEMLALNERIMLSLVSTGDDCPFIVNMTYAFQTPEKLYFVLDLMNGGDLHYHLSQHGKFTESEMRFYAAEVTLGLEHMHSRQVVYRDLKPANILLDEYGHVRISDLGLACDFSKKMPQASVGTHGYMAPEVLCKGQSYDSSADWFSLGCMLYKLLRGHSPFRQHKTRNKNEIDRMTMTMSVEMPESFSIELRSLLTGLLQRDINKRLGCRGRGAEELKSHPFFRGIDWRTVLLQRLTPPLIPARGEVNAADAFDIGSFDDEDTKHIRLTDADQELYRNFPVVVSERWQQEIAETIFDYINHEADKAEMKRKNKNKLGYQEEEQSDCILHGYIKRLGGTFTATWLTRYVRLYPNRLELWSDSGKQPELIFMDQIEEVCNDYVQIKNEQCIVLKLYNHSKYVFTNSDEIGLREWHNSLKASHKESLDMMTRMADKATKIYGTEIPLKHMGKRRQQLQQEASQNTTRTCPSTVGSPTNNSAIGSQQQVAPSGPTSNAITAPQSGADETPNAQKSKIANLEQKTIQRELEDSSKRRVCRKSNSLNTNNNTNRQSHQQNPLDPQGVPSADSQNQCPVGHLPHRQMSERIPSSTSSAACHNKSQQPPATSSSLLRNQASNGPARSHTHSRAHTHSHSMHHAHRGAAHHHRHHQSHRQTSAMVHSETGQTLPGTEARPRRHHHHHHVHHRHSSSRSSSARAASTRQAPSSKNVTTESTETITNPPANENGATTKTILASENLHSSVQTLSNDHQQISSPPNAKSAVESTDNASQTDKRHEAGDQDTLNKVCLCEDKNYLPFNSVQKATSNAIPSQTATGTCPPQPPHSDITTGEVTPAEDTRKLSGSSVQSGEPVSGGTSSTASSTSYEDDEDADEDASISSGSVDSVCASDNTLANEAAPGQSSDQAQASKQLANATSATIDQQAHPSSSLMLARDNLVDDEDELVGGSRAIIKLAVSIENVTESQQEVLRDPSKRITSDNKQREQDLVAQYEKLNINALKYSSSVDD